MRALVTLTHKVTVLVEGDNLDQITNWAYEHTPSEIADDCCKNGHYPNEDYDEFIEPIRYTDDPEEEADIKLD